jgi:hypothetical protein
MIQLIQMIKITDCSPRGSALDSQDPESVSQSVHIKFYRAWCLLASVVHGQTCRQNTHTHKIKNFKESTRHHIGIENFMTRTAVVREIRLNINKRELEKTKGFRTTKKSQPSEEQLTVETLCYTVDRGSLTRTQWQQKHRGSRQPTISSPSKGSPQ